MEVGTAIAPAPPLKKMRMDGEEQTEMDSPFPLLDESKEKKSSSEEIDSNSNSNSNSNSDLDFDAPPPDYVSGGGKVDLISESEMYLGEGSFHNRDRPCFYDDDDEQKYEEEMYSHHPIPIPLFDECQDSDSDSGLELLSDESQIDRGEGSFVDTDYPFGYYDEEAYKESIEYAKKAISKLSPDYQAILKLSDDEFPKKYIMWRRNFVPLRNQEEEALYSHVLYRTNNFEVPFFPKSSFDYDEWYSIRYEKLHSSRWEKFVDFCKQAIDEYNEKWDALYEFKYLIKICTNVFENNITFALTDPKYHSFVGRVSVTLSPSPSVPPVLHSMSVTRGEYIVPNWKDGKGEEYKCMVNEEFREKLPELEKKWKEMHPATSAEKQEAYIKKKKQRGYKHESPFTWEELASELDLDLSYFELD